jgi:hypothetical protein
MVKHPIWKYKKKHLTYVTAFLLTYLIDNIAEITALVKRVKYSSSIPRKIANNGEVFVPL